MGKLKENIDGYAHPNQREVLLRLADNKTIESKFFLTGGTALSVFYLHHRISIDLDLFSLEKVPLDELYSWISRTWPLECERINQNEFILQMLVKDIKVDIVYDPLSFDVPRENYYFDRNKSIKIDTLRCIASNKLCTMVGRREIKDFIDFYFIIKRIRGANFDTYYKDALKKEAMFDDPPTVAFQLENNLEFIKENPDIIPGTIIELDTGEFFRFYESLISEIYKMALPSFK